MENLNEAITNEEVVEVTEELVKTNSAAKVLMAAAGAGLVVIAGVLTYKYVLKPAIAGAKCSLRRTKSKKTEEETEDDIINTNICVEGIYETEDEEE